MSKEVTILNSTGVIKGLVDQGCQYYIVEGEDVEGNYFVMTFGCKLIYADATDKTFNRLFPVRVSDKLNTTENTTNEIIEQSAEVGEIKEQCEVET